MLCAGLCIPGWKPVVPEENLSAFRSATSKRQILFLWKAVGLAAPCQEASPLQKVFKLLWLLVWQTCPIPETQSFAVFLQAMLRTCQYSGFFQTESSPLSDRFLMEGQCHSGIGSSTQIRSLCSQRVSRHWPGNATAGLTTPARCPARVRGLSPVPLNHHSHDTGIPVHLPWCQGVQYLITGQSAGLLSRLYFCSLADYPPLTERETGEELMSSKQPFCFLEMKTIAASKVTHLRAVLLWHSVLQSHVGAERWARAACSRESITRDHIQTKFCSARENTKWEPSSTVRHP